MNNFNAVFETVKKHCDHSRVTGGSQFEAISQETGIPFERLDFYLSTLQDLGLIKYSFSEQVIELTSFGSKQEKLFSV